jgi:hypothetical protein
MTNVTSQRGSSMSISGHTQSSQDGSADAIGFVRATRSVRRRDRLPNPKPRLGHEGAPLGQCGRNQTIESLAAREGKTERWIRRTISLAFLSPAFVRAAIDGRLPRGSRVKRLMDLPMAWPDQWSALGLTAPAEC